MIAIVAVTAAVLVILIVGYKLFLFTAFEPEVAGFYGVSTGWVDTMFSLALAATIVVSIQVLGVTMIAAAIVIPPIIARLLTDSFRTMALLATAIGAFCGLGGVYLSYFVDVSSGASVVLFSRPALWLGPALWQPCGECCAVGRGGRPDWAACPGAIRTLLTDPGRLPGIARSS